MPRASELGDIMRSLPFSGFVSHARAALDPVERDLFQVDMETTMSSFDAFDRELERKLDEYYASCTLWDNDEETEYFFSTPLWEQQPKGLRNRDAPAKSNVAITAVARSNTQSTKGGIGGGRASRAPSAMSNRSATGKSIKAAPSVTGAGSASSVSAKRAATVNKGAVSARATALRPGSRIVANASTSVNGVRSTAAATATAYASVARRTTSTGAGAAPSKQAAAASMSVALSRTLGIQTPSSITSAARSGVRPPGVLRATKQQVRQPAPSATRAGPGASSKKRPPPLFDWRANEHDRLTEWTETTLAQMEAEVDARVVEL
ncbi:hypothetical protein K437DRAFT_37199 [Tilletiaria anomala UBC 951]|uniref:Uncharacterized protein n=1 Tax=Tilletiaria anomala (strain ATCC 24038 / CBS 436.72 / UBC 951) TaxID=1037660 RepID=A0A066VBA9_TILAU|nr:uncharacterized protein K437DRAFT_37199 [Tilletiaria anomala UBC 951]KDN37593.1 hypothetical protein K437DRAFT_37199 [Tilletiaria anomala UBC 951]